MSLQYVPRLTGVVWISLVLAAVGLATLDPVLIVGATIPLWFLGYAAVAGAGELDLRIERTADAHATEPGEALSVTLRVTNTGADPLPDLRVVDGVPEPVPVIEGTPRGCFALGPGESGEIEYVVSARRGEYAFDEVTVRTRNLVGTAVETISVVAEGADELTCELPVESVPDAEQTSQKSGRVAASDGGSGTEFYSVREYERGDPIRSIDWRRYARTDELTTIEYRAERAVMAAVLVDARPSTYVSSSSGEPTGAALSAYAADRTIKRLAADRIPISLLPLTDPDLGEGGSGHIETIGPGYDEATLHKAAERLDTIKSDDRYMSRLFRTGGSAAPVTVARRLAETLPTHSHVLLFTPAIDEFPTELASALHRQGYDVTVVTPDIIEPDEPARRLESVRRQQRLTAARVAGSSVVDWDTDRPLATAIGRAITGGEPR